MGFLDRFRQVVSSSWPGTASWPVPMQSFGNDVTTNYWGPLASWKGADAAWLRLDQSSPSAMWASQPHLRTVVSFLARNTAQLGLHVFERASETDRRRDRESVAARLLRKPNPTMTTYDLIYSLVVDKCLYDQAYWAVTKDDRSGSGWSIWRLPPEWVRPVGEGAFVWDSYEVTPAGAKESISFPASQVWSLGGYNPTDPRLGSPTLLSLKATLEESVNAARYRNNVWQRGGKVSAIIKRPKDAPRWSDEARKVFREDWRQKYTGEGVATGGTPILEDGMTLERVDFSASDQQYVEGAKLSFATVAAAFHVQPSMVGQPDGLSWASVREFRKMLYGDTLGPLLAQIEDRINTFLLPMIGADDSGRYVEFNIAEKLQGNFEEQTIAMQSAVGGPWLTRNEARARANLPQVDGGDDLITPLNVLIGDQASPRDSGSQNVGKADTDPTNRRDRARLRAVAEEAS